MSSTVRLRINNSAVQGIENKAMRGLVTMGFDIASQARNNAPYVTGALRSTIRVEEVKDGEVDIRAGGRFGNKKVAYAWKREQGPNRNPATEHYMENAAKKIMSGNYLQKYFGDITR